jgi:hypothetical protein
MANDPPTGELRPKSVISGFPSSDSDKVVFKFLLHEIEVQTLGG